MRALRSALAALVVAVATKDVAGASAVLLQPASRGSEAARVVVRLEGGDVSVNAALALRKLADAQVLPLARHEVRAGDSVCKVYLDALQFPGGCTRELVELASELNDRDLATASLVEGEKLIVPKVRFHDYPFTITYDARSRQEQVRMEDVQKHWQAYIIDESETKGGAKAVRFRGWELMVGVERDAEAEIAVKELSSIESGNVFVDVEQKVKKKPTNAIRDPRDYMRDCHAGAPQGDEGALGLLVHYKYAGRHCAGCNGSVSCPQVVLVDQPVFVHPDLASASLSGALIYSGETYTRPQSSATRNCQTVQFHEEAHHGTHLAGIIASASDGHGLIGVHPGARIHVVDWNALTPREVAMDVEDRYQSGTGKRLYLFASEWEFEERDRSGPLLNDPGFRLTRNEIARKIANLDDLWVVAAGQSEEEKDLPHEVEEKLAVGPMNLGDLKNVVVVTACTKCGRSGPALLESANYSREFVHIAAPGFEVPSTATMTAYATASGTSPAAAFVAGVAAAMMHKYPDYYDNADKVKRQLQATAWPAFDGEEGEKLASGILDPELALRDPRTPLMKLSGDSDMSAFSFQGWCQQGPQGRVYLDDPETGVPVRDGIPLDAVYRIVQRTDAAGSRWVFYTKAFYEPDSSALGKVLRIGPGRPQGGDVPILRTSNGVVRLSQIEDLLVPRSGSTVECSP